MSDNSFKKKMPSLKTMNEAYDVLLLKAEELLDIEKEHLYALINWELYDEYKFHDSDAYVALHFNEEDSYARYVMGLNIDKHFIIEDDVNYRSYDDECLYILEDIFSVTNLILCEIEYINQQNKFFK